MGRRRGAVDALIVYNPSSQTISKPDTHPESSGAFVGAVKDGDGKIIFIPWNSSNVGIYDPSNGSYTSGASHGKGTPAFRNGVLLDDGRVFFSPWAGVVGLYDSSSDSYNDGPSVSILVRKPIKVESGNVILGPAVDGDTQIRIFDPSNDTISKGATLPDERYAAPAKTSQERVIFGPTTTNNLSSDYIQIYDIRDDTISSSIENPTGGGTWGAQVFVDLGISIPLVFNESGRDVDPFVLIDCGFEPNPQQHTHTLESTTYNLTIIKSPNELQHAHTLEVGGKTIVFVNSPAQLQHPHTLEEMSHFIRSILANPNQLQHIHTLGDTFVVAINGQINARTKELQHVHTLGQSEGTPISNVVSAILKIKAK